MGFSFSSFTKPWQQPSTSKIKKGSDDDETLMMVRTAWDKLPMEQKLDADETQMMMVRAPWDKLPIDILSLIFERLGLEDRIRFNLVCKQWRSNTKRTPQLLWLMLPYDENYQYLSFFDMAEGKVRKLNLPESAQGGWFSGCSKGWLFLAKGTDHHNLQIFLFDPISRVQIPLPPLTTISSFKNSFTARKSKVNPAACIVQVAVSSSDASECIVAARLDNDIILALCRPHDENWTVVEGLLANGYHYGNILFSDGELYACILSSNLINQATNLGLFQTHSITSGNRNVNLKLIPFISPPTFQSLHAADADETIWYYKDYMLGPHLVESNAEILMVTQILDCISNLNVENFNQEDDDEQDIYRLTYHQVARFEVLKIRTTTYTVSINRLTDLGNKSLFYGSGVSLAAENFKEFDKNCIYFLEDDNHSFEKEYPLVSREAGVYYLDNGSIKRCFPSIKTQNGCLMHWFSPNIKYGAFS